MSFFICWLICCYSPLLESKPRVESAYESVLRDYVDENGRVDYKGLKIEESKVKNYLTYLGSSPSRDTGSKKAQMAFWINAYNAHVLALILKHQPEKSILEIKAPDGLSVWTEKSLEMEGVNYSLDQIENEILRPNFKEPRIHFALNCGSTSCPALRRELYNESDLEGQLEEQTFNFLKNEKFNRITKTELNLSQIFNWFAADFGEKNELIQWLNQYSPTKIVPSATITFLPYDWSLNSQKH